MIATATKSWMLYGVAGVAITALVVGAFYFGRASYRAEAASAQAAAVAEANQEASQRWQAALERQRERAEQHEQRRAEIAADLEATRERVEQYADSDAGQQQCLGEEGRALWNSL